MFEKKIRMYGNTYISDEYTFIFIQTNFVLFFSQKSVEKLYIENNQYN